MPTFQLNYGVDETEPTLIADGALQDTQGAEYRVGERGLFVARGRDLYGSVSGVTWRGLYEAAFDGGTDFLVAHEADNYYAGALQTSLTLTSLGAAGSDTTPIVGAHYANRHYTANASANRRFERDGTSLIGITMYPMGMSQSTFVIGASVTQGSGSMSATIGLEGWATEYDSERGIESVFGSTINTGSFSGKNSIIWTVTGVSANPRADKIRWYRSTDGGGYPDGGLIRETAIGTTQITDTSTATTSLSVPNYGLVSIGGLDGDRDEAPPVLSLIFGPFQDSLLGVAVGEPRVLRFTPAGFPDSWPSGYGVPLETSRNDEIVTGVVLPGKIGVFCNDSVHVIYRLPRDSDSIFAAGEAQEVLTNARGAVSRRGACTFTPPGLTAMAAWVARDGIWLSTLESSPSPATDRIKWQDRVDVSRLSSSRLLDDPINRRLVFIHWREADTTYPTGVWYLDYQAINEIGVRVTFGDHGPLADAVTIPHPDGNRRVVSADSRSGSGQVYVEGSQDVDDSQLLDSSGSVKFRARTKEYMPAGPGGTVALGDVAVMHDAGPSKITSRFYFNRRDDNPEVKALGNPTTRNASDVRLGRNVNSLSLELESVGTVAYGVHWIDIDWTDPASRGAREGA